MSNEMTCFAEYVHQWRNLNAVRDPDTLYDFVRAKTNLSDDERKQLAMILITEDYRIQRRAEYPIFIEMQEEAFLSLFNEKGCILSEQELTWNLIQVDIEVSRVRIYKEELIARFPLCGDKIEEYFRENGQFLASHFGHLSEAVKESSAGCSHKIVTILFTSKTIPETGICATR